MEKTEYLDRLIDLTKNVEVDAAVQYLLALTDEFGEMFVVNQVIGDLLSTVGKMWEGGKGFSLSDTYVTSKIVQVYLEGVSKGTLEKDPDKRAVFGNIKNDFQSSGRKLVIRFLEMDGWDIIDLGNDVDPEDFVEVAKKEGIRYIGVSAMLYENALHIKKLKEMVADEFLEEARPFLIAGGAIFTVVSDLPKELGITHTAGNALEAQKLFRRLYEEGKV